MDRIIYLKIIAEQLTRIADSLEKKEVNNQVRHESHIIDYAQLQRDSSRYKKRVNEL